VSCSFYFLVDFFKEKIKSGFLVGLLFFFKWVFLGRFFYDNPGLCVWRTPNQTDCDVTFPDDAITGKSQKGLKLDVQLIF